MKISVECRMIADCHFLQPLAKRSILKMILVCERKISMFPLIRLAVNVNLALKFARLDTGLGTVHCRTLLSQSLENLSKIALELQASQP